MELLYLLVFRVKTFVVQLFILHCGCLTVKFKEVVSLKETRLSNGNEGAGFGAD
jgi:hypothetical protein